ncbi:MAG TPA: FecR family protein, partial [Gemmataceae bacterium]|nr:FecR family protein [Gemmataceae bacterium]
MSTPHVRSLVPLVALLGLSALCRSGSAPARAEDAGWLTSRPLPEAKEGKPLAVGAEVRTEAGQRRRVLLPGGAAVCVNEKTTLTLEASGRLTLAAGEIFVEAPAAELVVKTPKREVTGRGTRFGVRAGEKGTAV